MSRLPVTAALALVILATGRLAAGCGNGSVKNAEHSIVVVHGNGPLCTGFAFSVIATSEIRKAARRRTAANVVPAGQPAPGTGGDTAVGLRRAEDG